jgi:heptosyltransferase-2
LNEEKILILQTAFIGDAVLTLPMIQKLNEVYPASQIDVVCIPSTKEIFIASPFINNVIVYDKHGKQKSFFKLLSFSKKLRMQKYSRIYSPHRSIRTAIIVMLSGVRETVGFSNTSLKYVYKNLVEYQLNHHEVQRNLDLIGFNYEENSWKILPIIDCDERTKQQVNLFLSTFKDQKLVAMAPSAVWDTKIYPIDYYTELIKFLISKLYTVILIGSQSDANLCEGIVTRFNKGVVTSAGKFTVPGTVELLKHCELLITNDSAPTHFAMAADIPTLTIYCSTIPGFGFYPYNKHSYSISYDELQCKPCGIHGYRSCPIKTYDCAHKIDAELIKKTIAGILDERKQ